MSFLLDPPLLLAFGVGIVLLDRRFPGRRIRVAGFLFTLALFWGVSVPLCYDIIDIPFHGYPRGSDFCLNSWVFSGLSRSPTADVLGGLLFAAYPAWLFLGLRIGERLRSRWGTKPS